MNRPLPDSFQPRLGLTCVDAADASPGARLPDDSRLQPTDTAVETQLRVILEAATIDALILEAVRPQAFDRTVLAPSRFHLLREQVTARLDELERCLLDPAPLAELQAAGALLRARTTEHELGETLRYALLKG